MNCQAEFLLYLRQPLFQLGRECEGIGQSRKLVGEGLRPDDAVRDPQPVSGPVGRIKEDRRQDRGDEERGEDLIPDTRKIHADGEIETGRHRRGKDCHHDRLYRG